MIDLTLEAARTIVATALDTARGRGLKPLAVIVYDARGALKCVEVEDGTSLRRAEIACGKANGALALGTGSRAILARAEAQPFFVAAVSHLAGPAALVPVPGGVLIRSKEGRLLGAVGISGDTSDNDEICAVAGIEAAGLVAETGA
ncbi:GlcG/HbpS family heme-binding protein [Methylobacterium sp. J-076]|uniref:GlcG/HbpS family heme-binding protein n=1 Tax=Methylobacterium sp. J-076 TaxID=2836655 RepID=UPI001FB88901|nr:heme-binding protein [Methylobacterium sp. J-076]MCJ2015618.1 heme-binding protein [Methylobacterium sp. J-076]